MASMFTIESNQKSASGHSRCSSSKETFQPFQLRNNTQNENEPEMIVIEKLGGSDASQSRPNPGDAEDDENSEDEHLIMAIFAKNGRFGSAHFDLKTSELFILNMIRDPVPEHEALKNVYRQVRPAIVLVDGRAPKTLLSCARSLTMSDSNGTQESDGARTALQILPSKEYNYEACKNRLHHLTLPQMADDISDTDREIFLNSAINFHYTLTVHAAGALLKYLDKNWCFLHVDKCINPTVLGLNVISLDKMVGINDDSYKALQIFNRLSHPSSFIKGMPNTSKEGLSLFAILNKCCCKMGRNHLRLLLQQPTSDLNVIKRRLDTIQFCNKPGSEEVVRRLCTSLRFIRNVNGIITRLKGFHAKATEWKVLFNTLYNGVLICEICENFKEASSLIYELGTTNNDNLFQVAHHMNRVIDFDHTALQGRFTVKLGVDPELDRKKQVMAGLHDLMSTMAKFELEKLPKFIKECTMIYLPNLGYLVGVKMWKEEITEKEKMLPNMKFMFQNDNCIYYKSQGCNELDCRIGDTYPEIMAHEIRIMMRLTKFIMKHLHSLSSVVKLCAELDCIISMAKVCKENDYKKPTLTLEKIIDIKNGRHPLQELCVEDCFVPNSTLSTNTENLMTILTGPNACGKSIYLKQVAMIVYMAHIGCYVPADSATIGLIDQIFTRIQTIEDITTRMSAFFIDLRQVSQAINECTDRSLVIMDEFGKGTTEIDGISILASCVNSFLFRDTNCPHIFVSTHFHSLNRYLIESPHLTYKSMEYLVQGKEIIFLYKLTDGVVNKSFSVEAARSASMPVHICERAKYILNILQDSYPEADKTYEGSKIRDKLIEDTKKILKLKNVTKKDILDTLTNIQ